MSQIGPAESLDAKFYYGFKEASDFMDSLSPKDIEEYLLNEFIDLGLIFFYSSFLYVAFSRLYHSAFIGIKYLALLPAIFDFIETKSIILILNQNIDPAVLNWLGFVTAAKWIFGAACFVFFILGLLIRLKFFDFTKSS